MICKLTRARLDKRRSTANAATLARWSSFFSNFQGIFEIGVIKVQPPSPGQHNWLIVRLKSPLGRNSNGGNTSRAFPFAEPFALWLVLGICGAAIDEGKNSISPPPTKLEIRTPCWPEDSLTTEDSTLVIPNYLSDVSRASFRRTTTKPYAFFKTRTTVSNFLQAVWASTHHKKNFANTTCHIRSI